MSYFIIRTASDKSDTRLDDTQNPIVQHEFVHKRACLGSLLPTDLVVQASVIAAVTGELNQGFRRMEKAATASV